MAVKNSFPFSKNYLHIQNHSVVQKPAVDFIKYETQDKKSLPAEVDNPRKLFKTQLGDTSIFSHQKIKQFPSLSKEKHQNVLSLFLQVKKNQDIQINYSYNKDLEDDTVDTIENFIFLDEKASLNLFEVCDKQTPSYLKIINYIYLQPRSSLYRLRVNTGNESHTSFQLCTLCKESQFFNWEINTSPSYSHIYTHSQEPHSLSVARGLNLLKDKQHSEQWICNNHEGEGGYNRQFYRNVLSGKSKNTTHSKVVIQEQEVDSNQMIQSLLLGSYAKAENRPELEVLRDRVKATHGATIGQPHPLEIFYLNSRGVSKEAALEFLVIGWIEQIFQTQKLVDEIKKLSNKFSQLESLLSDFIHPAKTSLKNFLYQKIKQLTNENQQ